MVQLRVVSLLAATSLLLVQQSNSPSQLFLICAKTCKLAALILNSLLTFTTMLMMALFSGTLFNTSNTAPTLSPLAVKVTPPLL